MGLNLTNYHEDEPPLKQIIVNSDTPRFNGDGYTVFYPYGQQDIVWAFHNEDGGDRIEVEREGSKQLISPDEAGVEVVFKN